MKYSARGREPPWRQLRKGCFPDAMPRRLCPRRTHSRANASPGEPASATAGWRPPGGRGYRFAGTTADRTQQQQCRGPQEPLPPHARRDISGGASRIKHEAATKTAAGTDSLPAFAFSLVV